MGHLIKRKYEMCCSNPNAFFPTLASVDFFIASPSLGISTFYNMGVNRKQTKMKSEGAGFTVTLGAGSILLLARMAKLDSFWVDGVILG